MCSQTQHADGRLTGTPGRLRPDRGQRDGTPGAESVPRDVPLSFPSIPVGQRYRTATTRPAGYREQDPSARLFAVRHR